METLKIVGSLVLFSFAFVGGIALGVVGIMKLIMSREPKIEPAEPDTEFYFDDDFIC